ncbi:MAG: hypothetical protein PHH93_00085 [Prolixibacteraceae bacterium]|nr:hypothetical protein [Prolixibacteraceae bacterium]
MRSFKDDTKALPSATILPLLLKFSSISYIRKPHQIYHKAMISGA